MSSSPAYEPDEDSVQNSGSEVNDERVPRSPSQLEFEKTGLSEIKAPAPGATSDNVIDLVDSESELDEDGYEFAAQNRFEKADAMFKTLRPSSLEAYTKLLAEMEADISTTKVNENEEPYTVTQNGAVIWTSTEKEVLFKVLDHKGKNGIKDIATAIRTKSELEVMDYLKLLQRGLEGQHLLERQLKTIIMGDIAAAAEISEDCCAELEKYSDALVMQEDNAIMRACSLKFGGSNGLLTEAQARKLLQKDAVSQGNFHLPASLLKLPSWIQLSAQLFMNFGGSREKESWNHHAQSEDESPVIYGEAFMDFYALAVSLTKRLVQSSLFFAMARLRDVQQPGRERGNLVRKRDVRAAMDVLNMQTLEHNHFLNVAKRHRLLIKDDEKHPGKDLSYQEAEDILNAEDDMVDSESEASDGEDDSSPGSPEIENNHKPPANRPPLPADAEEDHADMQDREQSRQEELRLWKILGKPGPIQLTIAGIAEEENAKEAAARKMPADRKMREDLIDWREHTLYRSEWEEYGAGLQEVEDELEENRRKRRRIELESDSDHDDANTKGAKQPVFLSASVVNSDDDEESDAQATADERPRAPVTIEISSSPSASVDGEAMHLDQQPPNHHSNSEI
ncbi:hypothetical protein N7468_003384 [Penicillium chermesinum]|uniref:Myb-like domain-containing protein n=1 Tax=Penicillium chermesinum TaxID=63820 RepID=A0A9W9TRK1_9EURO|nr:uncharacterized protein N7468_003384 [Penicillium chermesinum]KAJ5238765.1 hypothetical protein N7468_003384 [Penicillium chermesinum]KAJ6164408.1 hypothetical protein N7470_003080 [Penicillium chermesinum]